tara:strand:+ start:244 stop:477 length:234 start_codon:yes stop_codon:yes gene_type:complete
MTTSTTNFPGADKNQISVITEYGKQNMFATEPAMQIEQNYSNHPEEAEKANGRWAMLGFIALIGSYICTGEIIPGIF